MPAQDDFPGSHEERLRALERAISLLSSHEDCPHVFSRRSEVHAQKLEELKYLRSEIESIWNQTYTTSNFALVLIAAILATGLSEHGDARLLLPAASLFTVPVYRLIRVHTTRVWRIVAYLRCNMEVQLPGVKWETRLAVRQKLLASHENPTLDRDLFEAHIAIFTSINVFLLFAIPYFDCKYIDVIRNKGYSWGHELWWFASLLVPLFALYLSQLKRAAWMRGESQEAVHIRSWCDEYKYDHEGEPRTVRPIDAEALDIWWKHQEHAGPARSHKGILRRHLLKYLKTIGYRPD